MNSTDSSNREEIPEERPEQQELFPIVGIGASAGGLEAFTELLMHLPNDTGMGFVLVQHLSPDHKSLLTEILARATEIPVIEVRDGMSVQPNHIYIIPPNRKMTISQGVLKLTPRENTDGKHMPVDSLFYSLAKRGQRAIGVVLSGGDGDGALGLEAIKASGGITFAQSEESAKFHSMPHNAATSGCVDFILSPQEIAEELGRISHHPFVSSVKTLPESKDDLHQIFTLLQGVGIDFTNYKLPTLKRRIQRRLVLHKLEKLEDYVKYLQDNPIEVEALSQDFLIHVTSFFRDPEAFQALKNQVFPIITQDKSHLNPIRIWVPACSTGEEVYSIAICLLEFLSDWATKPTIQIFGTDISDSAIEKARSGRYVKNLLGNVSPERLQRFFFKVEEGYQVSKTIREMCVFAKQNLVADPPFSNLDLISCRNVLIYLQPALQKKVIPLFHYSLKPTGFLFLGISETTGEFSNLFALVDKKHKIYSRKLASIRLNLDFVTSNSLAQKASGKQMNKDAGNGIDIQKEAERIIWDKYAPVGVIVNNDLDILQFRGETSSYLGPPPGKPSFNLLKMAQVGLRLELRTALNQAKKLNLSVRKEGIQFADKEQLREVSFEVIPFKIAGFEERYFLVLFEHITASAIVTNNPKVIATKGKQTAAGQQIIQLKQELAATQQELAATKDYLQSIIQEQEGTNQDIVTANEEILSSNEELQSTNEELETAKEEIQATNEELHTTNDELRSRIIESNQINNDIRNFLFCTNIPIVMLERNLSIRRFTPMAEKIFNLIATDVGRSLSQIRTNIRIGNLEQLILEVIETLTVKEQEVQDNQGHWYDMVIRPYQTTENQIDGAVVALFDIHTLKINAQKLEEARDYAEAIVDTVGEPLIVIDTDLRVLTANQSFYETFQVLPVETESRSIFELGNGQWDIPQLRSLLEEVLPQNKQIRNFEVEHDFGLIGCKTMLFSACQILRSDSTTILLAIEDITERKLFEKQRDQQLTSEQLLRIESEASNRAKDEFLSIVSHELRNPLNSILGWTQLLQKRKFDTAATARALEMVEKSAKLQVKLIEDILDISRITTGKLQLQVASIQLAPLINAAIDVVRLSSEVKNIHIEHVVEQDLRVSGDSDRLQQVIWNLLSNAIKFTPVGGEVTVKLEQIDQEAQIEVSDTGKGISPEFLPYVFERFRQADSSSTRMHDGLGLGLSIVRYLVELHGGTVQAASRGEGQGTTMTVRLNKQTLPIETTVSTKEPGVPLDSIPTLEGLRVLVVDDDPALLGLLTTIIESHGALSTGVSSASLAIASLTENPRQYDVLLSDIGMPGEDGYALIRQVRALSAEFGGQIPAAALTGYASVEEQTKCLTAGFQRCIAKPINVDELVSIVAGLAGNG
ncbi:MAG: PAS domain-containing protein [Cyanomargarita calcarea GSE-NOS-MK-12-04C]|jgi:two-component system CheB/CheR fusion protein|uniref:Circadian input-output histidine kinase CikA n=1 Tax=Cyanomargarita calcarea GSE-NOS-MK-12-04C TaxID=2839659 RepID=A0A951QK50_9CYAN|nr:PAS domain-containing protein [Cyanomargarita calcarea GSE-NOS-MK-12-04C]